MKVFISWSGDLSRELGDVLRSWLPSVLQVVRPYFTPNDIEKGARWSSHIAKELEESRVGIFCLTADNLTSPWMMFEAGAISKVVGSAYVCPILFGIANHDVTGPLSQFQLTQFTKPDIKHLVASINDQCGEHKLVDETRDAVFEKWWPELEAKVGAALDRYKEGQPTGKRNVPDMLQEILSLTRLIARQQEEGRQAEEPRDPFNQALLDAARRYASFRFVPKVAGSIAPDDWNKFLDLCARLRDSHQAEPVKEAPKDEQARSDQQNPTG